jgi:hypothetical protein
VVYAYAVVGAGFAVDVLFKDRYDLFDWVLFCHDKLVLGRLAFRHDLLSYGDARAGEVYVFWVSVCEPAGGQGFDSLRYPDCGNVDFLLDEQASNVL